MLNEQQRVINTKGDGVMLKKAKFLSLGFLLAFATSAYASSGSISGSLPDEMNNKAAVEKEMSIKDQLKRQAEKQPKSEELKISNRIKLHSTEEMNAETLKKEGKVLSSPNEMPSIQASVTTASYNHNINWNVWGYGDIILGNGPSSGSSSSVPYGYYRHGATYDDYYGNFISAMPNKGVYRESKRFWETNYKEVVGYWVPDASLDQREKVISYLRQQMGEPYDWSSSKTNYDEWYCTKLPYVGYKIKASIDIDSNGGYWVTPDNIADDGQTYLFMRSEG